MQDKKLFQSGEKAPVSGNYQFVKHDGEVSGCIPRPRAYVHLVKGMKIPLHDDCQERAIWSLMTETNEDQDPRFQILNKHGL